ncbi:MAG: prevent-host-death family protein [Pseudomonadales bacterium]|nr:prevent-host-death family protein [Pseudomonadales bacterium]
MYLKAGLIEKANRGESVTVTTNGRVIATIIPPTDKKASARKQLNELATTAKFSDVVSPIDAQWDASQ